jgi:hypothetical protein
MSAYDPERTFAHSYFLKVTPFQFASDACQRVAVGSASLAMLNCGRGHRSSKGGGHGGKRF